MSQSDKDASAFAELPWWKRWKAHIGLAMPKWYQLRYNERKFWKHMKDGANGADPWPCICGAIAAAELNRRLGDDSLMCRFDKWMGGARPTDTKSDEGLA